MNSDDNEPRGDEPRDEGADAPAAEGPQAKPPTSGETVAREPEPSEPGPSEPSDAEPQVSEVEPSEPQPEASESEPEPSKTTYYDDPYDEYNYEYDDPSAEPGEKETALAKAEPEPTKAPPPPPPPTTDLDEEDEDDEGMLRMSFLEHLEELRTRLIRAVGGLVVAYLAALAFAPDLFKVFVYPFNRAAENLPYDPPLGLVQITPTEQFYLEYIKLPLLAAIFLGSPWLMFQAWRFISPGLYQKERRWAMPFIGSTASLFIAGGAFCYFVAMRLALGFLLGLGDEPGVRPMITVSSYYDMFFNLHVGMGVVFQMPIVIFFFILLRITSPAFLIANGRYAILIIFLAAAILTPTPDVTTMTTFAAPMILLYYAGIGFSYLVVYKRDTGKYPWLPLLYTFLGLAAVTALIIWLMVAKLGWALTGAWPFLVPPA